jgi:glycosyltransferase involved in cell wall biosynthesis
MIMDRFEHSLSVTVIILTYNEAFHIERCIRNIQSLAQRIIVVDSFSVDRTTEIAQTYGAEVTQRQFKSHADQFQWALNNCNIDTEWVLRVDADEYFEPAALKEIRSRLPALAPHITGVEFKRKFIFMGRWIRWGSYYPTILLRLWRNGAGRIEQRWMDEHAVLTRGEPVLFACGDLVDENLLGIDTWMAKHNRYATLHMVDFINREHPMFEIDRGVAERGSLRARWKRTLRNRVFGGAPLYLRSLGYFLYRYFIRLGFLDGRQGFVFHTLHGLCFYLLIDTKMEEAREFIAKRGVDAFREHLAHKYGIAL